MSCGSPQQPSPPYGHNQRLPANEIQPSNLYFTAQLSSKDWLSASLLQQVTRCTIKYQNMCEAKYYYERRLLEFRTDARRMLVKPTVMSTLDRRRSWEVTLHNYLGDPHVCYGLLPPAMDIYERLRANRDKLLETYRTNLEETRNLQATLIRDVLPSVTGELNLSPDATEWAREWLSDTCTYYICDSGRRHTVYCYCF